ncbi:MAG: T9SS type A sorting domain-containing protein, partial [Candidatus Eisenbacteria bacterium]
HWRTDEPSHASAHYGLTPGLGDSAGFVGDVINHDLMLSGLALSSRYYYRLHLRDALGNVTFAGLDSFLTQPSELGIDPLPVSLALSGAWPNPARGAIEFALALPRTGAVGFTVYDLAGRTVWRTRPTLNAGHHTLRWDGRSAAGRAARPGLYLARIEAAGASLSRRFVLVQ